MAYLKVSSGWSHVTFTAVVNKVCPLLISIRLESLPKELVFAQTEHYAEYSRYGNVVKTQEKAVAKSKYVEDELVNNHKSVWGSFFKEGKWGYKCCESVKRDSYCTV